MGMGKEAWNYVRSTLIALLDADNATLRDNQAVRAQAFHQAANVQMHLPAHIGDYTDFYSSRPHAENVGIMFRGPENKLMPNW
jgi:fumarylacetoacetase